MAITTTYDLVTTTSEFQANALTPNDQRTPDALGLSNGGFVVVNNSPNGAGIYSVLDFYDSSGVAASNQISNTNLTGILIGQPQLTQLANGNVLVVWDDNHVSDNGLFGRIYTSAGASVGSQFLLTFNSLDYEDPSITALSNGNFVVSYEFNGDVNFRIYNSSGAPQGGLHQVAVGADEQNQATITALSGGGFAVAYINETNGSELVTAVYDNFGTIIGLPLVIDATGINGSPKIAGLDNGGYAIAYTDTGWINEMGTTGITLVILSSTGGSPQYIHVNTPTLSTVTPVLSDGNEADPDITVLANGFIVVTWTDPFTTTNHDIFGAIFDQNGNRISIDGDPQFSITISASDDIASAVSAMLDGKFITVWQDSATDGSGGQITAEVNSLIRYQYGDAADDTITGDALNELISGGGGNDVINGGLGADQLFGGTGDDTFIFTDDDEIRTGETIAGGSDYDTIRVSNGGFDFSEANLSSIEALEFAFGSGPSIGIFASSQIGAGLSSNAQIITSNDEHNDINIDMDGTTLDLSNWTFSGTTPNVFIRGDELILDSNITGSSIADEIIAGDGADFIDGGLGSDVIFGGAGDDRIVWDANDNETFGIYAVYGGDDTDTLVVNGGSAPFRFDLTAHEFELAEHSFGIVGGAQRDTYNADWQRTDRTIYQDDGSRSETIFDPTNATDTVQIDNNFDTTGAYVSQFGYYDAGGRWAATFNIPGANDYIYNYFDAADQLDYTNGGFDDGRTFLEDNDQGNLNDWTSKYAVNTAAGAADYQYDYYDDGTRSYLDHDQDGVEIYLYQYTFYDASNVADYYYGKYNDGTDYYFDL